ncbi:MAG: efflux RND transporter permease subunit [Spartobacteria bacterium]|nr:efflux RND transporter permease subunit [Spartobacteria bacterium]
MIISNYAIKFRTAVFVFVFVLVIAGSISYVSLPREGTPDITIPYVFITAIYEGTSPEEMEKLITIPIEKKLNDVESIKEMSSVSGENYCNISIEFSAGEDIDLAKQRVKDKIDLAKQDLPKDLDEPIVDAFNFSSDAPVFIFALSGDTDLNRLKRMAEDLQDQIDQLPGIKEAEINGAREREIRIEIDLPRLIAYNIPIGQVMQRIAGENSTITAGNIEMAGDKFQVRIPGEFELVTEMRRLLLTERNGRPVYLTDIATVTDTFKDIETISRINGKPSISLSIKKRSGINAVSLIGEVKKILDTFSLPPGISLTVVMDQSDYVASMLQELENNITSGFMLVVFVLLLFLGVRNSIFVGLAIPFSMLISFTLLYVMGTTLNMVVLFSLVIAVGMLVDNAIVIVENIYRNRTLGLSKKEAARRGASEVAWPVITSTLTTLAAFSPLLFWPDVMGQFMGFLPRTLIIVLSASLFVALIINPAFCSVFIKARKKDAAEKKHPFVHGYERLLQATLHHRGPVLLSAIAFLILSFQIYGRYGAGMELFPDVDPRNATIDLKFPQGTSIERTDAVLSNFEKKLEAYQDIEFYLTTAGAGKGGFLGGSSGTHRGNIHIEFVDAPDRLTNSFATIRQIRDDIGRIAGAEIKVEKEEEGPPTGAAIALELSGDDFGVLERLSGVIKRTIETVPGLVDLQDDMEDALPELQFRVDRDRAALLGLDTDTIGVFLRMAIYGLEASKFRADEDEYDITIRLPENQRNTVNLLDRIFIPLQNGASVPLSSLGSVVYTGGRGAINRKDQKRVVTITGETQGRGVDKILVDIQERMAEVNLPQGYSIRYRGDNEDMQESGAFLLKAFGVALGLILIILVLQFNSVLLPAIILFSVAMSLVGVMWGLLICRMRFGVIMTGVGVISLAGIVVNNAIVLIDCIMQRKEEHDDVTAAIIEAGAMRLRPVLLTAITTILGLIPMAIGYSLEIHSWPPKIIAGAESSQWWAPMAVAVIFGLMVATVLTLLLVPAMYSIVESFANFMRRHFAVADD